MAAAIILLSGDPGTASAECAVGCVPPEPRPASWNTDIAGRPQTENRRHRHFPVPAPRPAALLPAAPPGPLDAGDVQRLRSVLEAVRNEKWRRALDAAASARSPLPGIMARAMWLAAPDAKASFVATLDFLDEYPEWPQRNVIRRRLEERLGDDVPVEEILRIFEAEKPLSGVGWLRYAQALRAVGDALRAADAARTAWHAYSLTIDEERVLLGEFGRSLTEEDQIRRLDNRIWKRDWAAARRQLRRVPRQWRLLGEARITLGRRVGNADRAVARVPEALRDHPGLVYERARWRRRSGLDSGAQDMLVPLPSILPEPGRWWDELNLHVRDRLRRREFMEAYRLASSYPAFEGEDRRQGAWLAGWIALEFLQRPPAEAMVHLVEARNASWHPADVSLAAYWQFRAALRMGNVEEARGFAEEAAKWPGTFFGQLALRSLGRPLELPEAPAPDNSFLEHPEKKFLADILLALGQADGSEFAWPFVQALLADTTRDREAVALVSLCMRAGMPRQALRAARRSISKGYDLPRLLFLIPPEEHYPRDAVHDDLPLSVALAVSNQESGFDKAAISHAGARGLMQLMPRTARHHASRLSTSYQLNWLVDDPSYNVRIGSSFLHERINRYDGSVPLALAAYNAGDGNVRKWLRAFGDPRGSEARLINWILLIPLVETRRYVQRVMERISAYEILLTPGAGESVPLRYLSS